MRLGGTLSRAINTSRGLGNQLWDLAGARPSLDLNFADNKSLVDATTGQNLVTFTRASSGTYVGSDGLIKTATTNLLLRSEEFDNAVWVPNSAGTGIAPVLTANYATAPNGTLTAYRLQANRGAGNTSSDASNIVQAVSGLSDPHTVTISIWAKSNTGNSQSVYFRNNTGVGGSVIVVTTNWQRFSITGSRSGSSSNNIQIGSRGANNTDNSVDILIWGAQLEQSSTVGEYIPTTSTINSAPRFDHNPITGESLGLLVEEQRTNSIRNNTMVGTVASTPGTLPTNWIGTIPGGLTRQIVGVGTQNGISYLDVRFYGTPTSTSFFNIQFEANTGVVAAVNQTWTTSVWVALVAGSLTNIVNFGIGYVERDSGGAGLASGVGTAFTPTSEFNRQTFTRTLASSLTAFYSANIRMSFSNTTAPVDLTIRIGLPQLEQGAFATSVIPTTTAAATRSADVASITGSNWSNWGSSATGTYYLESVVTNSAHPVAKVFLGSSTSPAESYYLYQVQNQADLRTFDSTSVLDTVNVISDGITFRGAIAYSSADSTRSLVLNGGTVAEGAFDGTYGTDLSIGSRIAGGAPTTGTIRRLTYWPARLANETLQRITQ